MVKDVSSAVFFFFSSRRRHTRFDCDWSSDVCSSDLYARRYNEALAQSRRLLEMDSMFFQVRVELARAYLQLGQCDEALAAMKHAPEQASGAAYFGGVWGWINARCGHPAQALAGLNRFRAEAREGRYVSHYSLAIIHAALGDSER